MLRAFDICLVNFGLLHLHCDPQSVVLKHSQSWSTSSLSPFHHCIIFERKSWIESLQGWTQCTWEKQKRILLIDQHNRGLLEWKGQRRNREKKRTNQQVISLRFLSAFMTLWRCGASLSFINSHEVDENSRRLIKTRSHGRGENSSWKYFLHFIGVSKRASRRHDPEQQEFPDLLPDSATSST